MSTSPREGTLLYPGYSLRGATDHDVDGLVEFMRACTAAHLDGERASHKEVEGRLHQPGSDPERDAVVVVGPENEIAGFAHAYTQPPHEDVRCFARVDPRHTGRGVGSALLLWAKKRACLLATRRPPNAPAVLHVTQWARDATADALLGDAGFRLIRSVILMRIDLSETVGTASVPFGVSIRDCTKADEPGLHRAHTEAFSTSWGRTELDIARWLDERSSDGRYDRDLWRVASAEDVIVGFALARADMPEEPEVGYVQDLGVIPTWRGRGLGLALLFDVFDAMKRRRIERAALHVDAENETGAVALYRRAGMIPQPGPRVWERTIEDPAT